MATKAIYSPEQTAQMIELYQQGTDTETIAQTIGFSVRSVIAKLAREGVYKAKTKAAGASHVTKLDLIEQLATTLEVDKTVLASLEKATKEALQLLVDRVNT